MKKIIATFDINSISDSVKFYSLQLAQILPAHLSAIFFESPASFEKNIPELATVPKQKLIGKNKESKALSGLLTEFEQSCQYAKVTYSTHHDRFFAVSELLQKSIYSDLIIISASDAFYTEPSSKLFLRHLFAEIQCPILIVPGTYTPIENVTLLYDGKPLSVYAIKMFDCLFGHTQFLTPEILTVKNSDVDKNVPNSKLMKDFIKRHFPEAIYNVLHGNAEVAIPEYLKKQPASTMVVLGNHQRNAIMGLFNEGIADTLIRSIKLPLLIINR